MQREVLRIINVDFDCTGQLLIIYSAFVKYWGVGNGFGVWGVGWGGVGEGTQRSSASDLLDFKKVYYSIRRQVLYNSRIEFVIHMNLVRLIKTCLNETYKKVRVGKYFV